MKKILVLSIFVLITISCSSEKEYKTPEDLIKANATYMNEEDLEGVMTTVHPKSPSYPATETMAKQIFEQIIQLLDKYKNSGEIKVETREIFEPNYKAKKLSFIQGKKVIELTLKGNRIILKELLKESE